MSLYIRGVGLPKCGSVLTIKSDGKVQLWTPGRIAFFTHPDHLSQAEEVPEHGRLIDADEYKCLLPAPIEDEYKHARQLLDEMPTVVPGDGEDAS